jgi:hypothetical protein
MTEGIWRKVINDVNCSITNLLIYAEGGNECMFLLENTFESLITHTCCLFVDSSETPGLHIRAQHRYYAFCTKVAD